MLKTMLEEFRAPGMKFRGVPLWAWNSKLERGEQIRQIRLLKEMGFGGFFMHARVGLKTPYLSEEWFECVRACVAEAERIGMKAWIYDEDRWPSGAAGGLVTRDDRFKVKELHFEFSENGTDAEAGTLAWHAVRFDGMKAASYRRIRNPENAVPDPEERIVRFYWKHAGRSPWFNGETYLDTMNGEGVRRFIETTHEAYRREIGNFFGGVVPGIFTDEPAYSHYVENASYLPWTEAFPEKFQARFGYDLLDALPELFFDAASEISRARHDFYELATELFVDAFARTIGEWCEKNGLLLTGHVFNEDSLCQQAGYVGSAMRFYEFMQAPGIDLLTEHWNIFNTAKQCSSAARQCGREIRLSETNGCTGWDFPLFGHKALAEWQFALGINLRCPHLAWRSMEGEAKRDYPASIFFQSPWFRKYRTVEDRLARIATAISAGEETRDILMIHPIESCWCLKARLSKEGEGSIGKLERDFVKVANALLEQHLDFDYGDEEMLARLGSADGKRFRLGKASYRTILIPELKTIRATTLRALSSFAEQGGDVRFLGRSPEAVDATPSEEAGRAFAKFRPVTEERLADELAETRRVSATGSDGREIEALLCHLSETEDASVLFICNVGTRFFDDPFRAPAVRDRRLTFSDVEIVWKCSRKGGVCEMDPADGSVRIVDADREDGRWRFKTSFAELQSRLFLIADALPKGAKPPEKHGRRRIPLRRLPSTGWSIGRDEPNVLVLDHAACFVQGEPLSTGEYVLTLDDVLRKRIGVPPRGGAMAQPWLRPPAQNETTLPVRLEYEFECGTIPRSDCRLVVERPDACAIKVNGVELDARNSGWWIDPSMRTIPLPCVLLKNGRNVVSIEIPFHESHPGVEAVFILGEFGVRNGVMTQLPSTLDCGDWCEQGFPHYAGSMSCFMNLDRIPGDARIILRIAEWRGTALGVRVNGSEEIFLPWAPYEADLTDFLRRDGSDLLEIIVYGHRRNALGPFYLKEESPVWTGPDQFRIREVAERRLVPCGLLSAPFLEMETDEQTFGR